MKNLLLKFLCVLMFILVFASNIANAIDLNINSVTYDNSSAILSLNSFDNDDYNFTEKPKLYIIEELNKAYFDINTAVLRCPPQDLIINSPEIKEVAVKQFSASPNIVRVVIYYNQGFNPKNIQLKKLNNTLFVRFKHPQMPNFYFQHIYSDVLASVNRLYESVSIKIPTLSGNDSIFSQINSAFDVDNSDGQDYILTNKDLILPTKYYIDAVHLKNSAIHLTGIGSATLSKPLHLTNPTRIVYDIPNAFVNPTIRNRDIQISNNEYIKIGQFDRETARVVITSSNAKNYVPVIFADTQRLVFINKNTTAHQQLFGTNANITSINDEINTVNTHTLKLVFSRPVIYSLERTDSLLNLHLYNIDKIPDINTLKSSLVFENTQITPVKSGGIKLSIPADKTAIIDIHIGTDGKTLRIRHTGAKLSLPNDGEILLPETQPVIKRNDGKQYIVIDPGHGGADCGAIRDGIYEKTIVFDISKLVVSLLEEKGYVVYMTRECDETVSLQDRVDISEGLQPDVFVSIHVNSSNNEAPNGIETHYYKDNSLQLAKTVHASMLNHIDSNNRGLFKSKFYVINHTTAPAILLETGFLSNPQEREKLISESRKQATAKAIAEGIHEYLKKQQ